MARIQKPHKLSFQLIIITVLLFTVGMAVSSVALYYGSRNIYLEAKNDMISYDIEDLKINLDSRLCTEWLTEYMLEHDDYKIGTQPGDVDVIMDTFPDYYSGNIDQHAVKNKLDTLDEEHQAIFARDQYKMLSNYLIWLLLESNYEKIYLVDISPENCGFVYCDAVPVTVVDELSFEKAISGIRWDYKEADHPAIKKIRKQRERKIEFEVATIDPEKDETSYIAYLPIGSGNAAICISYDWEPFRKALLKRVIVLLMVLFCTMLLTCALEVLVLRRVVAAPIANIERTVREYADDKDSKKVVAKMYQIKTNTEIRYLADSISDLALEIDFYNKETARMAAEKERAEKELYEAQVSIMVSQIQPHFMYNALSSIAMMCELDPEKAQEATIAFADYLRGNMDSLKQKAPVPFKAELEHLKNYLAIEKLRFGKKLNIEYDIQTDDFVLPALSIQPLVENAVKHGVGQKKKGGTVTISTRDTENAFEVIISDDGVGFDVNAPKKDDGRSHVGMENTRKRLKDLCGAEVITESVIGEGTTTRVILPKEGQKHEDHVL